MTPKALGYFLQVKFLAAIFYWAKASKKSQHAR
jgi:hypothetical protein